MKLPIIITLIKQTTYKSHSNLSRNTTLHAFFPNKHVFTQYTLIICVEIDKTSLMTNTKHFFRVSISQRAG